MPDYVYVADLREKAQPPQNGILSQTVQDGQGTRTILFGFAAGEKLSAHTAPYPAIITILEGEASLRLGDDEYAAAAGAFVWMPANLKHGIKAKTAVVMLLTMIKGG
jgi:quercetin dioxygenase-like cupin family protein